MTMASLGHRIKALEKKVDHLTQKLNGRNSTNLNAWIEEIHGTFKDDNTYRKAALSGRQWRKSQKPSGANRARKATPK
jgi:hypothetical protein